MSKTNILRVRRSDATDSHLLVHITQHGPKPLDLKFIGTEHTELFHGQIKDSQTKSLQASNYGGDLREWNSILRYAFLGERDSSEDTTENTSNTTKNKAKTKETHSENDRDGNGDSDEEILNNLDIAASIKSQTLTLTLRKNLPGGIVQRLGSIELSEDTNREAISPFDWVDEAVAHSNSLKSRLDAQRDELVAARAETEKLNSRLDELVKAKKEFERDLLEKCAALINAKKLKIRDQQRLLMGAKVEEGVAREVTRGRGGKIKREEDGKEAGAGKRRKVDVKEEVVDDEEGNETEGDDAEGQEEERQQEETPPPSVGDAAEDSEDEGFAAAPPARSRKESEAAMSAKPTSQAQAGPDKMDVDETEELPPKRELPFGRTSARATSQSASAASASKNTEDDEEDDDDTDDEEL